MDPQVRVIELDEEGPSSEDIEAQFEKLLTAFNGEDDDSWLVKHIVHISRQLWRLVESEEYKQQRDCSELFDEVITDWSKATVEALTKVMNLANVRMQAQRRSYREED
jgi:hypothetical protein